MYTMNVTMVTPDAGDAPFEYPMSFDDKKGLIKAERALLKATETLLKISEDKAGGKAPKVDPADPQTMMLIVERTKDGADYGGNTARMPNLPAAARDYLRSMLAGLLDGSGGRKKGA